jgi:2-oxoglutarate dehydrogenase E2 component (dihydrolipoamide succinyltransferase)
MSTEVRVPALPESVADATVLTWHKQPGDAVNRDESLVDLETDKVVLEVPAPGNGILGSIMFRDGATVQANDLLAVIEDAKREPTETESADVMQTREEPEPEETAQPALSPAVRRMIREMGLDPAKITGTGKHGRIVKADVMNHLDILERGEPEKKLEAGTPAAQPQVEPAPGLDADRPEQRVPMTRLRARVAERLVQAQHNAAILTTFNEVNLQAISELRRRFREQFEKQHEIKLGFMSFFVKASIEALKQFPVVNASVDGQDIIYHGYYDIGIAVGSPRGLVVPILRDCDQLNFAEIEQAVRDFGQKAKDGALSYEELTGGTFTISNGGVYGSMLSTPILNPPQSAILGMHTIRDRPVVEDGEIVVRPMMYLALSYDHRIVDGREAVRFLVTIKENLEDPARLLLQI